MQSKMEWNPPVAQTPTELADLLLFAGGGISRQLMSSPVLRDSPLRERLSELVSELGGLQADVLSGG